MYIPTSYVIKMTQNKNDSIISASFPTSRFSYFICVTDNENGR